MSFIWMQMYIRVNKIFGLDIPRLQLSCTAENADLIQCSPLSLTVIKHCSISLWRHLATFLPSDSRRARPFRMDQGLIHRCTVRQIMHPSVLSLNGTFTSLVFPDPW